MSPPAACSTSRNTVERCVVYARGGSHRTAAHFLRSLRPSRLLGVALPSGPEHQQSIKTQHARSAASSSPRGPRRCPRPRQLRRGRKRQISTKKRASPIATSGSANSSERSVAVPELRRVQIETLVPYQIVNKKLAADSSVVLVRKVHVPKVEARRGESAKNVLLRRTLFWFLPAPPKTRTPGGLSSRSRATVAHGPSSAWLDQRSVASSRLRRIGAPVFF